MKNRLTAHFKIKPENNLALYFTAGYPELTSTLDVLQLIEQSPAVDIIEIGIPYSDPLADGPTIQESGQKALENGFTLSILFEQLGQLRACTQKPVLLMGYLNMIMQYGKEAFFSKCQEVGVDGLIIPDMPLDVYEKEYKNMFDEYALSSVFLVTPNTTEERIKRIDKSSSGFIYAVSSSSITGGGLDASDTFYNYLSSLSNLQLKTPLMIGFGLKTANDLEIVYKYANGGIIGSEFIRNLEQGLTTSEDYLKELI